MLCYERKMRMFCAALSISGRCLLKTSNRKISHNKKNHNYAVGTTSGQLPLTSRELSPHMSAAQFSAFVALGLVFLILPHANGTCAPFHYACIFSSIIQLRYHVLIFGGQDNRPFAAKSGSAPSPPSR